LQTPTPCKLKLNPVKIYPYLIALLTASYSLLKRPSNVFQVRKVYLSGLQLDSTLLLKASEEDVRKRFKDKTFLQICDNIVKRETVK